MIPAEQRALWRQRIEVLATNVASGSREHREIAQAAALIRQDYHDRFLVELLQNANDLYCEFFCKKFREEWRSDEAC